MLKHTDTIQVADLVKVAGGWLMEGPALVTLEFRTKKAAQEWLRASGFFCLPLSRGTHWAARLTR